MKTTIGALLLVAGLTSLGHTHKTMIVRNGKVEIATQSSQARVARALSGPAKGEVVDWSRESTVNRIGRALSGPSKRRIELVDGSKSSSGDRTARALSGPGHR